ncbi:hypothetical protein HTZ84_05840 [Haloterrigena sp. SYSU A558-1]|uniref:Uncharacterized protein n=1 Tax=Haloterrigena gelatinilytica TaxID=2741724 RepID=A0ABX2LE40_9EURY|nr:hypothetical protein [Haloterrigena gelatinilytica]NUC71837.1 hypothetical protein [Haloterrigena gelatinilytica]
MRGRHLYSRRLRELEERLDDAERNIDRLENTLRGIVRETDGVSVGGPCKCGESLLIVRHRTVYCPHCKYRRAI